VTWSERRKSAFSARLHEAGYEALVYRQPMQIRDRAWEREQPFLTDWLRRLPTPIGLLACNDERGRKVLECCRLAQLQVPAEVAVLGIDNNLSESLLRA
jgi:LacI family transcriptional regulator